jgi:hypothetical protein
MKAVHALHESCHDQAEIDSADRLIVLHKREQYLICALCEIA